MIDNKHKAKNNLAASSSLKNKQKTESMLNKKLKVIEI